MCGQYVWASSMRLCIIFVNVLVIRFHVLTCILFVGHDDCKHIIHEFRHLQCLHEVRYVATWPKYWPLVSGTSPGSVPGPSFFECDVHLLFSTFLGAPKCLGYFGKFLASVFDVRQCPFSVCRAMSISDTCAPYRVCCHRFLMHGSRIFFIWFAFLF